MGQSKSGTRLTEESELRLNVASSVKKAHVHKVEKCQFDVEKFSGIEFMGQNYTHTTIYLVWWGGFDALKPCKAKKKFLKVLDYFWELKGELRYF